METISKLFSYLFFGAFSLQASVIPLGSGDVATAPETVQNVIAEVQDGILFVTWDEAGDPDGEVVGYKVYYGESSVDEEGKVYDDSVYTPATEPYYVFEELPLANYYFAVTSIDNEGNESLAYSEEIPVALGEGEGGSPDLASAGFSVVKAEHINPNQIVVEMSDNVVIESYYNAFIVEDTISGEEMFVGSISTKGPEVYLTIQDDRFRGGNSYQVTASSSVVNRDGEPVSSGITDSVEFAALYFENGVALTQDLPQVEDENEFVDDWEDTMTGEEVTSAEDYYFEPTDVAEEDDMDWENAEVGPELEGYEEALEAELAAEDQQAPQPVGDVAHDLSLLPSEKIVLLFWEPNTTDSDVAAQKIYVQKDGEFAREVQEVSADAGTYRLPVEEDFDYKVSIVAIDQVGNESLGKSTTFGTYLNRVGPSNLLAWVLFALSLGYYGYRRRIA